MKQLTIEYHFARVPQIGQSVKVYIGKKDVKYGYVCGYFTRIEHIKPVMDKKGKTRIPYDIHSDCVMLKETNDVQFHQIDFFLESDRVDFIQP
jgi:hypothetical protein